MLYVSSASFKCFELLNPCPSLCCEADWRATEEGGMLHKQLHKDVPHLEPTAPGNWWSLGLLWIWVTVYLSSYIWICFVVLMRCLCMKCCAKKKKKKMMRHWLTIFLGQLNWLFGWLESINSGGAGSADPRTAGSSRVEGLTSLLAEAWRVFAYSGPKVVQWYARWQRVVSSGQRRFI